MCVCVCRGGDYRKGTSARNLVGLTVGLLVGLNVGLVGLMVGLTVGLMRMRGGQESNEMTSRQMRYYRLVEAGDGSLVAVRK